MMKHKIACGDVLEVMKKVPDNRYHGMLTDPPYGLGFMGKEWDHDVPSAEVWSEILRTLKPGAYGLVFGGTRMWHRLAVNLEDAGFEIRDTLMWVYGSGFPKSHNISKALDKRAGAEREVVGTKLGRPGYSLAENDTKGHGRSAYGKYTDAEAECSITAPATRAAIEWDGYGTALKPAWEPIILVRKPVAGTIADNAMEYGCGGLNIDGCGVGTEGGGTNCSNRDENGKCQGHPDREGEAYGLTYHGDAASGPKGRFPANLIHDGSDEVVVGFPNEASRFFYAAKASKKEKIAGLDDKNPHPTVKPLALNEYLARLILPPSAIENRSVIVPFSGVGSEMIGALLAGWDVVNGVELDESYVEIANKRIEHWLRESD